MPSGLADSSGVDKEKRHTKAFSSKYDRSNSSWLNFTTGCILCPQIQTWFV